MKAKNWVGTSARRALANSREAQSESAPLKKSRNATNCTMSRMANLPFKFNVRLSPSNSIIEEKSAFPIPTMMMEIGKWDAAMMAC